MLFKKHDLGRLRLRNAMECRAESSPAILSMLHSEQKTEKEPLSKQLISLCMHTHTISRAR